MTNMPYCTKTFAWGGFCIEGKTSLYCFSEIMDAAIYVDILLRQLLNLLGDETQSILAVLLKTFFGIDPSSYLISNDEFTGQSVVPRNVGWFLASQRLGTTPAASACVLAGFLS